MPPQFGWHRCKAPRRFEIIYAAVAIRMKVRARDEAANWAALVQSEIAPRPRGFAAATGNKLADAIAEREARKPRDQRNSEIGH
jgi:hypothetical protein